MDENGPEGTGDGPAAPEPPAPGPAVPEPAVPEPAAHEDVPDLADVLATARPALAERRTAASHRLAALTGRFDEVVAAAAGSNLDDEHDPEGATIAFERSQIDALARQAAAELAEVDAAEARITAGTYGTCERCGAPIPAGRLQARPTARTCVGCASR